MSPGSSKHHAFLDATVPDSARARPLTSVKPKNGVDAAQELSAHLQVQIEEMLRKAEFKKVEEEQLEIKIYRLQGAVGRYRNKRGGYKALRLNEQHISKQVRIMGNRIMKAKQEYMLAKARADEIRKDINQYRSDRLLQDGEFCIHYTFAALTSFHICRYPL